MMVNTHAFVSAAIAIILFWNLRKKLKIKHGRLIIYALYCGIIPDFDFASGMIELIYKGQIPPTIWEFISRGRQNHPIFTHHVFTFIVALTAFVLGMLVLSTKMK
ncbi:MAG: hypothetical protein ACTSRA_19285, partial [Promethearchaeota archaeon]